MNTRTGLATGRRIVLRKEEIDHVREYLPTPGAEGERPPILAFTGVDGSGKTTTLKQLGGALNQKAPWALVDCAEYAPSDIPELLTEIRTQLSRECPGYRLWFPRFETGLAVTREEIDPTNQKRAVRHLRRIIRKQIRDRPRAVEEILGEMAREVVELQAALPLRPLSAVVEPVVQEVASRALANPLALRQVRSWYGHRDQGLPNGPIGELLELNRMARMPQRHPERDRRLTEALLADMRAAFSRGRLARPGLYNCVVLLDNADTESGRALLGNLRDLRRHFQTAGLAAEPLLLVVSGRGPIPGDYVEHHPLPAFSESDAEWLASHLPADIPPRFAKLIHLCTNGYPAAAACLVSTACSQPAAAEGGIGALLDAAVESDGPEVMTTVEERVRQRLADALLGQSESWPFPQEALEPLTTCAAARSLEEAERLLAHNADGALLEPELLWQTGLWDKERATGAHALFRWLLLRRLARGETEHSDWHTVHQTLRERCAKQGDTPGELYYALANGEVAAVAMRLTEHLSGEGIDQPWLSVLRTVTTAPRAESRAAELAPFDEQVELTRALADRSPAHLVQVARIVAGLWIANDPCTGPDRADLHRQIAVSFGQVAARSDRPPELFSEAERHTELARSWS